MVRGFALIRQCAPRIRRTLKLRSEGKDRVGSYCPAVGSWRIFDRDGDENYRGESVKRLKETLSIGDECTAINLSGRISLGLRFQELLFSIDQRIDVVGG